jgi:hypothetical protein
LAGTHPSRPLRLDAEAEKPSSYTCVTFFLSCRPASTPHLEVEGDLEYNRGWTAGRRVIRKVRRADCLHSRALNPKRWLQPGARRAANQQIFDLCLRWNADRPKQNPESDPTAAREAASAGAAHARYAPQIPDNMM